MDWTAGGELGIVVRTAWRVHCDPNNARQRPGTQAMLRRCRATAVPMHGQRMDEDKADLARHER